MIPVEHLGHDGGPAQTSYHPSQRRPQDASTLILVDFAQESPRVLMGRRHQRHAFMPGKFVFPGGRVDPPDGRTPVFGTFAAHVERQLLTKIARPSPTRARALALAAVRELAEETGLLLGSRDAGAPNAHTENWALFAKAGVFPTLDGVALIARAITPPGRPRRYDTRFFAADASLVGGRVEGLIGPDKELVETAWVTLEETSELDLPDITRRVLSELAARLRFGLDRDMPVPFFRPRGETLHREEI